MDVSKITYNINYNFDNVKRIVNRLLRKLLFFYTWYHYLHDLVVPLFRKKNEHKIFCIGYVKTGTSSLSKALKILGYNTVRLPYLSIWRRKKFDKYIKKLQQSSFDAFTDYPLGQEDLYKKIDKLIPNSKFILTIREKQSFGKSFENYFRNSVIWNPYYTISIDEILNEYEERNNEIIDYFKDKPDQLLVMNITESEGWDELCAFLDKPIPKEPFPHENIGKYKTN